MISEPTITGGELRISQEDIVSLRRLVSFVQDHCADEESDGSRYKSTELMELLFHASGAVDQFFDPPEQGIGLYYLPACKSNKLRRAHHKLRAVVSGKGNVRCFKTALYINEDSVSIGEMQIAYMASGKAWGMAIYDLATCEATTPVVHVRGSDLEDAAKKIYDLLDLGTVDILEVEDQAERARAQILQNQSHGSRQDAFRDGRRKLAVRVTS
ncbi:hypothetical protein DTW90_32655 [Neorhizobium sp. P12A]|nr:hypothetical protein DTW90_32655 [Neorhizobium sp. P12A]